MAINLSMYDRIGNMKAIEPVDYAGAAQKGMQLSAMSRQNQAAERDDAIKAQQQKLSALGGALESMEKMTPEQRKAAYPQVRAGLVQSGVFGAQEIPPEHDEVVYRGHLDRWKQTPDYLARQESLAKINHLNAQAFKDRAASGPKGQGFELGSNLRKEWTGLPTTKATQEVSSAYNKIQNAASDPSAAGDLSLLYGFNKLLDPGSAVKEQEFANAAAAGSVDSRIRGQWQKVISGQRLSPEQRADFIKQSNALYSAQLEAQNTVDGQYTALAQRYGVDPSVVMMKFPNPKELKIAVKQEESKPGFFEGLFGSKTAQASTPKPKDYNAMNDEELFQAWSARQGKQ